MDISYSSILLHHDFFRGKNDRALKNPEKFFEAYKKKTII